MIPLFLGDFSRPILVPRPFEGSSICKGGEGEKKDCYYKNVKTPMPNEIQMPKCKKFCFIIWILGLTCLAMAGGLLSRRRVSEVRGSSERGRRRVGCASGECRAGLAGGLALGRQVGLSFELCHLSFLCYPKYFLYSCNPIEHLQGPILTEGCHFMLNGLMLYGTGIRGLQY